MSEPETISKTRRKQQMHALQDIGERLGCGAHLCALRRTGSGPLRVEDAITLDALAAMSEDERLALLRPPDSLLQDWPALRLDAEEAGRFLSGLRRRVAAADAGQVRVYGPEPQAFLGSAHVKAGELIAEGVLAIEMGATAADLKLTIHPHPTLSETVMESAEVFFGQATHVYKPKKK